MPPMTMRRRPDSITTRLCPHYRFQKGRQKILNYDTVDMRHKHYTIVAPSSTRGNCANERVVENKAEGMLFMPTESHLNLYQAD